MTTFRIASSLIACALLVVACGDDKGDTQTSQSTTDSTPQTGTDPGPTTTGTTGPDVTTSTTVDPDTTNGSNSNSMSEPTTEPTTAGPTTDPTETTGGGDSGMFCQDICSADADCKVGGTDLGFTCVDSTCTPPGCESDGQCQAMFSGWTPCAAQADCMMGTLCIDAGSDTGYCAYTPSDIIMCSTLLQSEVMYPPIEGGDPMTVCASTGFACDAETKSCVSHCSSDADCMDASMPVCNMGTGACECGSNEDCLSGGIAGQTTCTDGVCGCGSDADCVGNPGGSKCASLGFCGCASDQECAGKPNADTCYDGACGCSSDMNCTMPLFDNTQSVCKNF